MKRRAEVLVMDRIGGSDRVKLAQATRSFLAREMVYQSRIAGLERCLHSLELDLSLAVRFKPDRMPASCYRDPRTAEALPMRVGHRGIPTAPVLPAQEEADVQQGAAGEVESKGEVPGRMPALRRDEASGDASLRVVPGLRSGEGAPRHGARPGRARADAVSVPPRDVTVRGKRPHIV